MKAMLKTTDGFVIAEEDLKLRGPGEFFGARQSGIHDLKIADLIRDQDVLIKARKQAFDLVERNPDLRGAELSSFKKQLVRRFKDGLGLIHVS